MISHRSHRLKHRSLAVVALATLVALLLPALSAAAQGVSDSSGSVPAEQSVSLSIPGFDSSVGELAQVDLIVSGSFEGRVSSVTSRLSYAADVIVTSEVDVCAHVLPAGEATTYMNCLGAGDYTTIFFTADVLGEAFVQMPSGSTTSGASVTAASGAGSVTILDPSAFASFVDEKTLNFAASSTTRAEASTDGNKFHDVSVETFTDITVSAQYGYIALALDAAGGSYTVTNTGNMRMVDINVVDAAGSRVCAIYALAPSASEACSGDAAAGPVTVSGAAGLNPGIRTTAGATAGGSSTTGAAVTATQNSIPAPVAPAQADGAFGFASVNVQPSVQAAPVASADDTAADSPAATSTSVTAAATNPPAAAAASAAEAPPVAAAHPAAATESATAAAVPSTNSTAAEVSEDSSAPSPASTSGSVVRVAYQEDNAPFLAYTGGDAGNSAILGFMLTGLGLVFFAASRAVRQR